MAAWVKQRHPTPIVALVEALEERVALAEHNVSFTEPGRWLNCMRAARPERAAAESEAALSSGRRSARLRA
jgi:hypothetical protein